MTQVYAIPHTFTIDADLDLSDEGLAYRLLNLADTASRYEPAYYLTILSHSSETSDKDIIPSEPETSDEDYIVQRAIKPRLAGACPEHRRKHQKCPHDCLGRK
jgi:hypothetical protein